MTEVFDLIWAKKSSESKGLWLPLYVHMSDTCGIARCLWQKWLSVSIRAQITKSLKLDDAGAMKVICFLAASHDIGKCMPSFQAKTFPDDLEFESYIKCVLETHGLFYRTDLEDPRAIGHATLSQWVLEKNGVSRQLAVVVGGHHGKPPYPEIKKIEAYPDNTGLEDIAWNTLREEFLDYAMDISKTDLGTLCTLHMSAPAQALATGIVIMADWISSNEYLFPLAMRSRYSIAELESRVAEGWSALDLPSRWKKGTLPSVEELCKNRFGFEPRPFQEVAVRMASESSESGLYVVEAPMGEGKTEAALGMAEEIASKFGLDGVFFALPTQATADGVFPRIIKWINRVSEGQTSPGTIFLAHGKSRFNKVYSAIPSNYSSSSEDRLITHEWFYGKKKGLLSDFVVGTVDQVLMAGLKRRHLAMRHLGLAGKVVIIDEVHAYDEYMGSYLEKSLTWLGAYNVPVILLSATLPLSRRKSLINAYLRGKRIRTPEGEWQTDVRYPLITSAIGAEIVSVSPPASKRTSEVRIIRIDDQGLYDSIDGVSTNGGYVGIIVNTVKRAQQIYLALTERYGAGNVRLLHSRFTGLDRTEREAEVMDLLNKDRKEPPFRLFVVGTQVMEQSLDFDFDVLFTDLCPMDLLIQRMGRLHRHANVRPAGLENPICYVIDGNESSKISEAVYGKYQLMNSRTLIPGYISLPSDIPTLVQKAYGDPLDVQPELRSEYAKALADMEYIRDNKERRAKTYQIFSPGEPDLMKWLDNDLTGRDDLMAEATVRDTDGSVDVILVRKTSSGEYFPVSGGMEGAIEPLPDKMDGQTAFLLAGCKVSLPHRLVYGNRMQDTVEEIISLQGQVPGSWRESCWLKGELFLQLDENNIVALKYGVLKYDNDIGLVEVVHD